MAYVDNTEASKLLELASQKGSFSGKSHARRVLDTINRVAVKSNSYP
jgi:hypothetical protein